MPAGLLKLWQRPFRTTRAWGLCFVWKRSQRSIVACYQSISCIPLLRKKSLALLKCLQPKNPYSAERGDGWTVVRIKCLLLLIKAAFLWRTLPKHEYKILPFITQFLDNSVCEDFPSHVPVRAGFVGTYCEDGIHRKHALRYPTVQISGSRNGLSQVLMYFLEYVCQRTGNGYSFRYGKADSIILTGIRIRSCPSMTTFTFSNGQELKTWKI